MSAVKRAVTVVSQQRLADDVYSLWLAADSLVKEARPGQFFSVFCQNGERLLPRPISICEIDREQGYLRLVYRVVGAGTREFSSRRAGEKIEIMGPLGNGYTLLEGGESLLIAGGIGIPPLLELAKELKGEKTIVLGYANAQTFLMQELKSYGCVLVATEDGSCGVQGNVMDVISEYDLTADRIYSCGPRPMLKAVQKFAEAKEIPCQISMEERMACGIGACLSCVCLSSQIDKHSQVKNKRVCKDGPVFDAREIEL